MWREREVMQSEEVVCQVTTTKTSLPISISTFSSFLFLGGGGVGWRGYSAIVDTIIIEQHDLVLVCDFHTSLSLNGYKFAEQIADSFTIPYDLKLVKVTKSGMEVLSPMDIIIMQDCLDRSYLQSLWEKAKLKEFAWDSSQPDKHYSVQTCTILSQCNHKQTNPPCFTSSLWNTHRLTQTHV